MKTLHTVLLIVFFFVFPSMVEANGITGLLSVGNPGPDAEEIYISLESKDGRLTPGDRVSFKLKTKKRLYMAAVFITADGDVAVLVPNKENPDGLFMPGTDYTLFGQTSNIQLRVSGRLKEILVAFYTSSIPFAADRLRAENQQNMIIISKNSQGNLNTLESCLIEMAKSPDFNRKILVMELDSKDTLRIMGWKNNLSDKPATVLGVQGHSQEKKRNY